MQEDKTGSLTTEKEVQCDSSMGTLGMGVGLWKCKGCIKQRYIHSALKKNVGCILIIAGDLHRC